MKSYWLWLTVIVAALIAASFSHAYFVALAGGYLPPLESGHRLMPWTVFLEADFTTKMLMNGLVMMIPWGAVITVLGARELSNGKARTEAEVVLRFFALSASLIGLAGGLWSEGQVRMAVAAIGPVSASVTAPARAEAWLCIAIGFFVALVSLSGATFLYRRSMRAL